MGSGSQHVVGLGFIYGRGLDIQSRRVCLLERYGTMVERTNHLPPPQPTLQKQNPRQIAVHFTK